GEVFSFDAGQVTGISVFAGGGSNTVRINRTLPGVGVAVNADGTDTVLVGNGNLDNLKGGVVVYGDGATGVEVYDDARTFNDVYTVTGTTLSRPSFGGLASH